MSKVTARPAKTFPKAENPRAETVRRSDCREEKVHPSKICQKASSTYFINKKQKYKLHHQVPPTLKYTSLVKNQVACVWSLFSQAPLLRLYFAFKANCQSGSQMTTVPLKGRAQSQSGSPPSSMKALTGLILTTWGWTPRVHFIFRIYLRWTGCKYYNKNLKERVTAMAKNRTLWPQDIASADCASVVRWDIVFPGHPCS